MEKHLVDTLFYRVSEISGVGLYTLLWRMRTKPPVPVFYGWFMSSSKESLSGWVIRWYSSLDHWFTLQLVLRAFHQTLTAWSAETKFLKILWTLDAGLMLSAKFTQVHCCVRKHHNITMTTIGAHAQTGFATSWTCWSLLVFQSPFAYWPYHICGC